VAGGQVLAADSLSVPMAVHRPALTTPELTTSSVSSSGTATG